MFSKNDPTCVWRVCELFVEILAISMSVTDSKNSY